MGCKTNYLNQFEFDIIVYGMPIYKIEELPYEGLYGNATRAFGLANNFAKMRFRTALVVQTGFSAYLSTYLCDNLQFIEEGNLSQIVKKSRNLLFTSTNFSASLRYNLNPFIEHINKFCICCFDYNGSLEFRNLMDEMFGITFNNIIQKKMWDSRKTQIPSHVVSYGVNEFGYIDEAIKPVEKPSAIWVGEIRRRDILERIVNFATSNTNYQVDVVTRKVFDQDLSPEDYGGTNRPYADFEKGDPHQKFYDVVKKLLGLNPPNNLKYLGTLEGQNYKIFGTHTIGLDFSRFPQKHDNTKVLDYLRSGLAVICDDNAPSYRYVKEFQHGYVLPYQHSKEDMQKAFALCEQVTSYKNRRHIAEQVKERYGWDKIAATIVTLMKDDEKCRYMIKKKRNRYRLLSPVFKVRQNLLKASRKFKVHLSD